MMPPRTKRLTITIPFQRATEVVLFGSLAHARNGTSAFSERSDIDLAARGISADQHYRALGHLLQLGEFAFDLVW